MRTSSIAIAAILLWLTLAGSPAPSPSCERRSSGPPAPGSKSQTYPSAPCPVPRPRQSDTEQTYNYYGADTEQTYNDYGADTEQTYYGAGTEAAPAPSRAAPKLMRSRQSDSRNDLPRGDRDNLPRGDRDGTLMMLIRVAGVVQIFFFVAAVSSKDFASSWRSVLACLSACFSACVSAFRPGCLLVLVGLSLLVGLLSAFRPGCLLVTGHGMFLQSAVTACICARWLAGLAMHGRATLGRDASAPTGAQAAAPTGAQVSAPVPGSSFAPPVVQAARSNRRTPHSVLGACGIGLIYVFVLVVYAMAFGHNIGLLSNDAVLPQESTETLRPAKIMMQATGAVYCGMKLLVLLLWASCRDPEAPCLTWFDTLVFLCFWPGMNPGKLVGRREDAEQPDKVWIEDCLTGIMFAAFGGVWCIIVRKLAKSSSESYHPHLQAMVALFILFYLGGVRLLRAFLGRFFGYTRIQVPYNDPHLSKTLSEFWDERFCIFLSDATQTLVKDPVEALFQEKSWEKHLVSVEVLGSFAFIGVLLEVAISVPVFACSGSMESFGWPMLYAMLQGSLVFLERRQEKRENERAQRHMSGTEAQAEQGIVDRLANRWKWLLDNSKIGECRVAVLAAVFVPLCLCHVPAFCHHVALPIANEVGDYENHIMRLLRTD